jgi:hypothetical protein
MQPMTRRALDNRAADPPIWSASWSLEPLSAPELGDLCDSRAWPEPRELSFADKPPGWTLTVRSRRPGARRTIAAQCPVTPQPNLGGLGRR